MIEKPEDIDENDTERFRVCQEMFPLAPGDKREKPGFYMNPLLQKQLDYLIKNIVHDWDFTILITGKGEVRVGKSELAKQIAAYWVYQMWKVHKMKTIFNLNTNVVFNADELISKGHYLGAHYRYSPLLFDEAGADLDNTKVLTASSKAVKDYFRECGQYNLLNILVLPDFFDLPKGIAVSRSRLLIDVSYTVDEEGLFQRGMFRFYSKPAKKMLYIRGKKYLDYNAWKADFKGAFKPFDVLPDQEYRRMKDEALRNRDKTNGKVDRVRETLIAAIKVLRDLGYSYRDIEAKLKGKTNYGPSYVFLHDLIAQEENKAQTEHEKILLPC